MQNTSYLIDSNIILDVLCAEDNEHTRWSVNTLKKCARHGNLAINQIIYAEIATKFDDLSELENCICDFMKISLPWEAAFIASKAFLSYRRNSGIRLTPLPDFYIGAHSLYARLPLVSRDSRRYRTYFPHITLIAPD